MTSMDPNHVTAVYFLVTTAKLIKMQLESDKIFSWVLSLQLKCGMFSGGPAGCNMPHLANTYTALCILI